MSFIIDLIKNLTVFIYTDIQNSIKKKRNKKFQLNKILDKFSAILYCKIFDIVKIY